MKFNKKAYNELFICANKPININDLVGFIKININNSNYTIHIPIIIGYIMASILDFLSKKLRKEYLFSKRRLSAMTRETLSIPMKK